MKYIALDRLNDLFAALSAEQALYIPADNGAGQAAYTRYADGVTLSDALNTVRSAKDFFFPQTENLVEFKVNGPTIEVIDPREECEDFVIFGVRGCDVRSFDILDRVFLTDPVDSYYQNRREHCTIVSLACTMPEETCFCTAFGIDPTEPAGDVTAWKTDSKLILRANTEKGEALLTSLGSLLCDGGEEDADAQKKETAKVLEMLPLKSLPLEAFHGDTTKKFFDSPEWKELSEACLGCGTCTFVCPTCQCYDIRDFDTGSGIVRFRCWDSCMYSDFTQMSAGQPRLSQLERFRQRFMHKLVYYPMNNEGIFGCVGCGRCLSKCPISMNIVKVLKALEEASK